MTHGKDSKHKISELRPRAESSFPQKARDASDISSLSPDDLKRLVHDLQVHQIELEMQNDELRTAQIKVEELKDRYQDLYDFAPVAYLTLDQTGAILEANLTSAKLFGVERGLLIGKPLASFVNEEDGDSLYLHFRQVLETQSKQTCELRLTKEYGNRISVRIESLIGKSSDGSPTVLRTAVIDITSRKHAEEALHTSELRYRRLFQSAQDGILILDFDTGLIVDVNPYLIDMLGYSHEDFLEKCLWEVSPFKDTYLNRESFEKLRREGYVRYEDLPLETSDGRSIEVEFVSNTYPVNAKTFIQCNIRDITKRKHEEEQLRVETARSRLALDILKQLNQRLPTKESVKVILETLKEFTEFDAIGIRLRDGEDFPYFVTRGFPDCFLESERYLCSRDAAAEIIRDSAGNPYLECMCGNIIMGRTDPSFPFFTEKGSFWSNCTTELLATTTEEDRQNRTRNHCNSEGYESVGLIPLRSEGDIIGLLQLNDKRPNRFTLDMIHFLEELGESLGVTLNACQLSDGLRESENKFRSLVEQASEMVFLHDESGRIVDVNQAAVSQTGYTRKELLSMQVFDIDSDTTERDDQARFWSALQAGDKPVTLEVSHRRKDGSIYTGEMTISKISLKGAEYILAMGRDITERKKTEKALDRARTEWEWTFNAIPDLVMVLDSHHKILRANKSAVDALGMTEERMIGKSCHELFHGARRPPALCPHSRLLADGKEHYAEVAEPRLGGTHEVRVSPLIDRDGRVTGSVHVSRDITDRKRAEELLEKSQASFFNIVDKNYDGILVLDDDDTVRYANAAASSLFGKPVSELTGTHFGLPLVSEEKAVVYLPRPDAEPTAVEMTVGSVDWHGTPCQVVMLHDITDRATFEETLKASEERMRLLIESSPIGIRFVREGQTVYVNPAFIKIFGYESREEIMGLADKDLYGPEDVQLIRKYEEECLSGKRTSVHRELKALKKNGKLFDVSKWLTTIEFEGKPAVLGFVADISQGKSLETQLLQAQKMEAIGTLSGGIAHDFNNILTIVSGFSELLLAEKEETDKDYPDLQKIFRASQNGAELVRQLLTFSRKVETKLQPAKLNLQVKNVEKLLTRTIPKTIRIELSLAEDLKIVNADPAQIEQALMNLAINARHAMPDGGKLIFETRNVTLGEEYSKTHVGVEPGEHVLLSVSDTGHGMERHVLERIFEPFFTTKKAGEGTGLGLAMVYGIVKGHGGHVACYSEVGVGTTFKIHLPVYQEVERLVEHKTEVMPAGGTETLLLVDDEKALRTLGTRLLSRAGYKILVASNGLEGLEAYRENREKIALVILDLIMPEMDGKHCLQELLKVNPQAKVIISSGYSSHGPVSEVMQSGAKGFVEKPYRMNDLLRTVRRVLDESRSSGPDIST